MRIIIDTNVIIDIFSKREPWFQDSYAALHKILQDENSICMLSASAVTDIFYLLRKAIEKEKTKLVIEQLSRMARIVDVQDTDIQRALNSPLSDFEDAVVDAVAYRHEADFILTRNVKDFENSSISAITPPDFLKLQQ